MQQEPIEERYFNWLYEQVASVEASSPSLRFYGLFRMLHRIKFEWYILGDDNRAEDGEDLRVEFLNIFREEMPHEWYRLECSVLECLIALARRAEFQTMTSSREWFWMFIKNLGLKQFSDNQILLKSDIKYKVSTFLGRSYDPSGEGGLFPLESPREDQRTLQLWDQLSAYLAENEYL